jgi:MFS transporter, UMF1 family
MTTTQQSTRREIFSWCLFDWGNSAYPTVITTFVFAAYFTQAVAPNETEGTFLWGQTMAIAGIVAAIAGTMLGAVADRTGGRKRWLATFTVICITTTALLWFVRPDVGDIWMALILVGVSTAAFEFTMVFYNALLPEITGPNRYGRVSGWGWGLGYLGGLLCLVVALVVLIQAETPPFGLDKDAAEHVRATALLVALWFAVFSVPLFLWVRDPPSRDISATRSVSEALRVLADTLRRAGAHRQVLIFLAARMLYADGLTTLFAFGGIYAAGTFGLSFAEIIQFGIALNVTAGLGAFGFSWIDDRVGAKPTIVVSLIGLLITGAAVLSVTSVTGFWVSAMALGIFVGPVQSASRSMMAHLAPADMRAEMFGLFALSGRATSFLGPALVGWVTLATDSQRIGMTTILSFWLVGLCLLWFVRGAGAGSSASSPSGSSV